MEGRSTYLEEEERKRKDEGVKYVQERRGEDQQGERRERKNEVWMEFRKGGTILGMRVLRD